MKTSIDKNLTTIAQAAKVKNDLKELKAMYTDGDLLYAFLSALDGDEHTESAKDYARTSTVHSNDIVCCDVEGFPAGYFYIDDSGEEPTHFAVTIKLLGTLHAFYFRFYTDLSLNVRLYTVCMGKEHKMYDFDRYTLDNN